MPLEDLASSVLRQQEEERLYAIQKGRTMGIDSIGFVAVPLPPVSVASSDGKERCDSPSLMPTRVDSSNSLRGAGAVFLTRYSRRQSSGSLPRSPSTLNESGPPCGARTSIPDRMVCCQTECIATI